MICGLYYHSEQLLLYFSGARPGVIATLRRTVSVGGMGEPSQRNKFPLIVAWRGAGQAVGLRGEGGKQTGSQGK